MIQNKRSTIASNCANWDNGKCCGVMIKCNIILGKKTTVAQWINKELANKPCIVLQNKPCHYWNAIVTPGITNGME